MKTNRFATVMLFACVVLFATHTAQAFYNPTTGRWLSRDPIGERGGAGLYTFVANSPVKFVDVLGREPLRAMAQKTFIEMATRDISSKFVRSMNQSRALLKLASLVDELEIIPYNGTPQYRDSRVRSIYTKLYTTPTRHLVAHKSGPHQIVWLTVVSADI
jgi:uncharacterized protein RhaS with RHS repeats